MQILLSVALIFLVACAPVATQRQTLPARAGDTSSSGEAVVQALVTIRGQFVGDGINFAFLPASPADSITLATATGLPDEQMLALIDCLADTSSASVTYEGRPVSRGAICYFAGVQTQWFYRNRNMPVEQLLQAIVTIGPPHAERQRRASAIWRELYVTRRPQGGRP